MSRRLCPFSPILLMIQMTFCRGRARHRRPRGSCWRRKVPWSQRPRHFWRVDIIIYFFPSILKTIWILPVVCRVVLYSLYWHLTYLFKCIFYYFVDHCSVGSVLFDVALMFALFDPSTLWTLIKFATLVGSVHSVECGRDPWWPSTLWTCIILWTGWVRPLCGLGSWTLVESVHFVDWRKLNTGCVRPLCGLVFTIGRVRPFCGLV